MAGHHATFSSMPDENDEKWLKKHIEWLSETEWQKGQFWIVVAMILALGITGNALVNGDLALAGIYGNWALAFLLLGALRREHRRGEVLQRRSFRILCCKLGVDDEERRKKGLGDLP